LGSLRPNTQGNGGIAIPLLDEDDDAHCAVVFIWVSGSLALL
jgi:hypothetical protein